MSTRTKPKLSLIQRYSILKWKLEGQGRFLRVECKSFEKDDRIRKVLEKHIRLHREALELLEDVFNGEDGEVT